MNELCPTIWRRLLLTELLHRADERAHDGVHINSLVRHECFVELLSQKWSIFVAHGSSHRDLHQLYHDSSFRIGDRQYPLDAVA
jgi:hypothetical protein